MSVPWLSFRIFVAMIKRLLSGVFPALPILLTAQSADPFLELARFYKNNMFGNEPTKEAVRSLETSVPDSLAQVRAFIVETALPNNDLLKKEFLALPEERSLKQLHLVRQLDLELRKNGDSRLAAFRDSLGSHPPQRQELIRNYYTMLFASVGNKNKPFDLSRLDLRLNELGLANDAERAVVFLECMDLCRSVIWGFMNIVKPANTSKAKAHIAKFPRVNGEEYYRFGDLIFDDFTFVYDDSLQSYKNVMIHEYMDLLLMHLLVLDGEKAREEDVRDLLLGSALRNERLYAFTRHRPTLESIFKKQ